MAADPRKISLLTGSRRLVPALAILFGLLAVATLPARRHEADALLLAHGDGVDVLARSYAGQIVHPSFLAQIRPRIRPIDGHRLSDGELRSSISAQSVDSAGLVRVTARAGSAQAAEALANDVAVALSVAVKQEAQQHEAFVRDELRSRAAERAREIARLGAGAGVQSAVVSERLQELQAERTALVERLAHASVLGARQSVGPMLVAAPHAALEPLLPRLVRRLLEGLLLGSLVGFGAVGLLGLRAGRQRRTLDDSKPLERRARAAPESEPESHLLPQPVVRATPPSPPSAAAPLMLVADPPLPRPAPATTPLPVQAPVAALPRLVHMLELAELERLVVASPAPDPYLQEERQALLVSLRGYAGPDGVIPARFHSIVYESFGDLLGTGAAVGVQA